MFGLVVLFQTFEQKSGSFGIKCVSLTKVFTLRHRARYRKSRASDRNFAWGYGKNLLGSYKSLHIEAQGQIW